MMDYEYQEKKARNLAHQTTVYTGNISSNLNLGRQNCKGKSRLKKCIKADLKKCQISNDTVW
jgi:hypothetical protein